MTEINRRTFIQLAVVSGALATGLSGCKNEDIWKSEFTGQYGGLSNKAYPYVNPPDGAVDGVPIYYASTCQMCSAGCGIYVRTLGGRANKIEGNPYHPINKGKTCLRGQLALQHLYNPDRLMHPMVRSDPTMQLERCSWESAIARLSKVLLSAKGTVAIVVDGATIGRSPTKIELLRQLSSVISSPIVSYSLVDDSPWRAACQTVYGKSQLPDYRLDLADLIVSFGGNFLETWPSPVRHGQLFGEFRQGKRRSPGSHGQFVYVGARMSMTASKADQWIPCIPGTEAIFAQGLLGALNLGGISPTRASEICGLHQSLINDLALKIRGAGKRFLAIGGDALYSSTNITESFVSVERLNAITKSMCVGFGSSNLAPEAYAQQYQELSQLINDMSSGRVSALLFVGAVNPTFTLPNSSGWSRALAKVPFTASIGSFLDETTSSVDIALASRTFLEEWGDFIPAVLPSTVNTNNLAQPVIDPTFITRRHDVNLDGSPISMMDTRETNDILIDLLNEMGAPSKFASSVEAIRHRWASINCADLSQTDLNNDRLWTDTVSAGGNWSEQKNGASTYSSRSPKTQLIPPNLTTEFRLILYPHIYFDDGRHANLGWAQEMPDPLSNVVWNNWVEINQQIAHQLSIRTGDIVRLSSNNGSLELPALPSPGIHPSAVAVPIGQGHTSYGRNAINVGRNPINLVDYTTDSTTGALAFCATTVSLTKVRSAVSGYHPELNTLVLVEDRDGGQEPAEVMGLIHETAREWRQEQNGTPAQPTSTTRIKPII